MDITRQTALEIFNLNDNFTTAELNKRYRELSKIVHPDTGGDENLFKMLTCCKDVLTNTSHQSAPENNSASSSEQKAKTRAYINLKTLDDIYFSLSRYLNEWDIYEIHGMARVQISPRWRKDQCTLTNLYLKQPFEQFQRAGFVSFSEVITIPEALKKFKAFSVRVEFMGETYRFKMSAKKPVHTIKYEHYLKFNSVLELRLE